MCEGSYRPWVVYMYTSAVERKELGRFANRMDADHQILMLRKFTPGNRYEVVFEPLTVENILKDQVGDPFNSD